MDHWAASRRSFLHRLGYGAALPAMSTLASWALPQDSQGQDAAHNAPAANRKPGNIWSHDYAAARATSSSTCFASASAHRKPASPLCPYCS